MLAIHAPISVLGQERDLALIMTGNLTTSSELYPNPNAADAFLRSQSYLVEDFYGAGFELRYRIPESAIAIGIAADYVHAPLSRSLTIASRGGIPVEDGYEAIPVEVTGYFIIPASGPRFGIFMGGGIGAYFGRRTYRLAGVEALTVDRRPGFGIHVLGGVSYRFIERLSVIGQMKFRDLQFETSNQFPTGQITYNGAVINVGQKAFASRVNTDGVVFQLGIAVHL